MLLFVGLFFSFNTVNILSLLLWIAQQLILVCIILGSGTYYLAILPWFRKVLNLKLKIISKAKTASCHRNIVTET